MNADRDVVDKPSIRAGSRILLLDGGSLDKVRTWDGKSDWENRVSSLTAENVAWLDSEFLYNLAQLVVGSLTIRFGSMAIH